MSYPFYVIVAKEASERPKMCASIPKKPYLPYVIERLNAVRTQKGGEVKYSGFDYLWFSSAIETIVSLHDSIPRYAKTRIVSKSLHEPTKSGKIDAEKLKYALKKYEDEYLNTSEGTFILKASISVSSGLPFKKLNLDKASFGFIPNEKLSSIPDHQLRNPPFHGTAPENYHDITVRINGKTDYEAGNIAIDRLDLIRGFWNLLLNKSYRMSFGSRQPINEITTGPFFTLHNTDGTLSDNGVWHDPNFTVSSKLRDLTHEMGYLKKQTLRFQRYFNSSPFQDIIRDAMLRYVRALDGINYEETIVQLWSILESLTLYGEGDDAGRHADVVRRAASIYQEQQLAAAIIDHIRVRRNEIVHRSRNFQDSEGLVYQSKSIVENLIFIYIGMFSKNFQNKAEIRTFLDLPREKKMLDLGKNFISQS